MIIGNDNIFQEFTDVLFLIKNERYTVEKITANILFKIIISIFSWSLCLSLSLALTHLPHRWDDVSKSKSSNVSLLLKHNSLYHIRPCHIPPAASILPQPRGSQYSIYFQNPQIISNVYYWVKQVVISVFNSISTLVCCKNSVDF